MKIQRNIVSKHKFMQEYTGMSPRVSDLVDQYYQYSITEWA